MLPQPLSLRRLCELQLVQVEHVPLPLCKEAEARKAQQRAAAAIAATIPAAAAAAAADDADDDAEEEEKEEEEAGGPVSASSSRRACARDSAPLCSRRSTRAYEGGEDGLGLGDDILRGGARFLLSDSSCLLSSFTRAGGRADTKWPAIASSTR